jgi:hypothetical protein
VYEKGSNRYPKEYKQLDRMRSHNERAIWTKASGAAFEAESNTGTACRSRRDNEVKIR